MNNQVTLPPSIFPARMQILSGSALKLLACICMLIDHVGVYILSHIPAMKEPLITLPWGVLTGYQISRDIGRIAFPLFCFLLVEGFAHTHSRIQYAGNLLLFALISEPIWNWAHTGTLRHPKQNVYFTLLLGYLGCWAIEYFWEKQLLQLLCLAALFGVSWWLNADYGWKGYVFILILYCFRSFKVAQAVIGSCWMHYQWKACFAFIPINMYNGKRGFIRGKAAKYFFYLFYPLHILVLGWLRFRYF